MKIPASRTVAAALVCLAAAATAFAKAPRVDPQAQKTVGVLRPVDQFERADGVYNADGSAAILYRPDFALRGAASPKAAADAFIGARQQDLGLDPETAASLVAGTVRPSGPLAVVRYTQKFAGLPVWGSDLAISVVDGAVVFVNNDTVRGLQLPAASPGRGKASAAAAARAHLGSVDGAVEALQRMIYRGGDGATRIVWQVAAGSWEVLVDDATGAVVRAESKSHNADGQGRIHVPDPLSKAKAQYGDPGFVDGNGANTAELGKARKLVTLRDVEGAAGKFDLDGPWAACRELEAPNDAACPVRNTSTFTFVRSNKFFDAVNTYYHIDTYMRYVNLTLGVAARPTYAGGVHYDPHGFSGADNSHFVDSQGGFVTFGQGGVDDAEDADVVVHELGHGLHSWATAGHLSQVEGLSEGVGDYAANSYSRDIPKQWKPTDPEYFWVFNWDGHNPFWPGRVTNWNIGHTYPGNIGSEIHDQGQYWASCNMLARQAIGAVAMDRAFWTGLSMTGANTSQKSAAQAVLNAANALGYTTAQKNAIGAAYNQSCTYNVTVP